MNRCPCCRQRYTRRCECYDTPLCQCGRCWLCCECGEDAIGQLVARRRAKQEATARQVEKLLVIRRADRLAACV